MKVFSLVTILFILTSTLCKGQRHLSFELGGSGGLASINLENTIHQKGNLRVAFRSGFSYIPIDKNNGGALFFLI